MNEGVIEENKENRSGLRTLGIMLVTIVISVAVTIFMVTHYLFPRQFDPVELSKHEETVLNKKLRQFGLPTLSSEKAESKSASIEPEAYSEEGAKREVDFSEKELNAMLATNSDLAGKMAIDLSESLASIKMIIPLDPDFPLLGGKTLKVNAGAELGYANGRPVVALKGVSVWGVPIPNAWLGNLKNVDLVREFGGDEGFWKSFADGVENIRVEEGNLKIKLKE